MSTAYNYAIKDDVLFQFQDPQGRDVPEQRSVLMQMSASRLIIDSIQASRQVRKMLPISEVVELRSNQRFLASTRSVESATVEALTIKKAIYFLAAGSWAR